MNPPSTPLRSLIVGMGGLSSAMSKMLRQVDWQRIVGVVDIRPESLQKAQTELDLPDDALFTDLAQALSESNADVVLINTPSELHFVQCQAALLAGKDVLVAKPITNNFEQAVELVDLAAARGRKLCVGQQMRFHRHFQAVKQFVANGELGRVEMANFFNAKPRHQALNLKGMSQPVLYEISCHHFDSLLAVFPQQVPESIFCDGFRPSWSVYDGPCSVNALIHWSDGLHMLYHGGISSQSDLYEFRLEGERGALRCRGIHMSNDTMHYDFAPRGGNFAARAIDENTPLVNPWTIFFEQWQSYMTTGTLADGSEPHFTGRNNLKVFAMLSAGIDSIEKGQRVEIAGNPALSTGICMSQPNYTAIQHLDHDQFGYLVSDPTTGRCLGGVGANYYRAWVFPLYTPNGLTVIQEFSFDHPFHNGFWVAQGPIFIDDREVTFWPAPPMRKANEALFTHMGRMETVGKPTITPHASGVHFTLRLTWRDKNEQPVLDEVRTIDLYSVEDATVCDMISRQTAAYGTLDFAQTKFGSIGIRVEPRLLPLSGGVVIGDGERRGSADLFVDQKSDFIAYENELAGQGRFGVCMCSLEPDRSGPWFVRDYGMALYAPMRMQAIHLPAGETWNVALRVAAYEGLLTNERSQRWCAGSRF